MGATSINSSLSRQVRQGGGEKPYYAEVDTRLIDPDPNQPRKHFDEASLNELAESIAEHGVLQAITVVRYRAGMTWRYRIVYGERRWRAACIARLTAVPSIVVPEMSRVKTLTMAMVENMHRDNMTIMDEAAAYAELRDTHKLSVQAIGRRVNRSSGYIDARLMWHDRFATEPEIQQLVNEKMLPVDIRVSEALLQLPAGEVRVQIAQRMVGHSISAIEKGVAAAVRRLNGEPEETKDKRFQAGRGDSPAKRDGSSTMESLAVPETKIPAPDAPFDNDAFRQAAAAMCRQCDISAKPLTVTPEPAWLIISHKAAATCRDCGLDRTEMRLCRMCPGVKFLRALASGGS